MRVDTERTVGIAFARCITAASFIMAMSAHGQPSSIRVSPTVSISSDDPKIPLGEAWLARNPRDPNNMIAAAMAFSKDGPWASVMYYTMDAGKSWNRVVHGPKHDGYFWGADPVVMFGSDGTAYYSDLEAGSIGDAPFDEGPRSYGRHANVFMFRSADGGRSWNEPIALYGDDHTCIAVDESRSKYRGRVYAAYTTTQHSSAGKTAASTVGFAYSDDNGTTYRQRVFLPLEGAIADRITEGPSPTDLLVAPDGTVVLVYILNLKPQAGMDENQVIQQTWVMTSADGGRRFSEPHLAGTATMPTGPTSKLNFAKIGYWPRMAADASQGPNRGRLYLAYEDYSQRRMRIVVASSKDIGQTWTDPVQVNDDHTMADDNTPGIAVSENGTVGVSWYDRRSDPKNDCFQEFFSASLDGGATFLPNVVVHVPPTCPLRPGNWQPNVSQYLNMSEGGYRVVLSSPGPRFVNGGETQGIAGGADGSFHLAWINGESGVMQLASTAVEVTAPPRGMEVGELLEVITNLPTLDINSHVMTMQVTATNRSRRPMKAPLTLVLSGADSIFEGLRALNSDNDLPSAGASWLLVAPAEDRAALQPGETAQSVTLKFEFKRIPEKTWEKPSLDVNFHIFEAPAK